MSQWRRLSLANVPTCKQAIEVSRNSDEMWLSLWDEFEDRSSLVAQDTAKAQQIYEFALWCHGNKQLQSLNSSVWQFFHALVEAYVHCNAGMRRELPHLMSLDQFCQWVDAVGLPGEQIAEAKRAFSAAMHKPK